MFLNGRDLSPLPQFLSSGKEILTPRFADALGIHPQSRRGWSADPEQAGPLGKSHKTKRARVPRPDALYI